MSQCRISGKFSNRATSSSDAFAAIVGDKSVVTWGMSANGADSKAVQGQLRNVQQILANGFAFAAIPGDGSVVTWGKPDYGGDNSAVQQELKYVQQFQVSTSAFAAILDNASVVTWSSAIADGESNALQHQLKNMQQIQAHFVAFAAILGDGSVVSWGSASTGGESSAVQLRLKNAQQIQATTFYLLARKSGAMLGGVYPNEYRSRAMQQRAHSFFAPYLVAVVSHKLQGVGDSCVAQGQLKTVQQVQASFSAFAAFLADGSAVTWGSASAGCMIFRV